MTENERGWSGTPRPFPAPRGRPAPLRFARPAVEHLEGRCLLATFTVTTAADAGPGSLRQAILQAEAGPDPGTIVFSPGLNGQTIQLDSALPALTRGETVSGPGPSALTVRGGRGFRVFTTDSPTLVTLAGLTITGGNPVGFPDEPGGGVLNHGLLALNNDALIGNDVGAFGRGGGVASEGPSARLWITGSTIANNRGQFGAGIAILDGSATIDGCSITGNTGEFWGGGGAGIFIGGELFRGGVTATIRNSTIANNTGQGNPPQLGPTFTGAGIDNSGSLTVLNCTIVNNTIQYGGGGGIANRGSMNVLNCTVVNNTVLNGSGGGIDDSSLATGLAVSDSTITGNVAGNAGGIHRAVDPALGVFGPFTLNNTVVAQNTSPAGSPSDLDGPVTSGGGNFIGAAGGALTGLGNGTAANQVGTIASPLDPLLGPLQDNGGPTLTRAPLPGSPLLDRGSSAALPAGVTTDQRGFRRLVNGAVDVGAVEVQPWAAVTLTASRNPATFGQAVTYTARVAGTAPGSPAPTGTVTFRSGDTELGTAVLGRDGVATLTTGRTPQGIHPVVAGYSGDATYPANTSRPLDQVVLAPPPVGTFDPGSSTWYLRGGGSAGTPEVIAFAYGLPGWAPVTGGWAGSGQPGIGVVDNSPPPVRPVSLGLLRFFPLDTSALLQQIQPGPGPGPVWYLRNSNGPGAPDLAPFPYGAPGWVPVAGDWNGSGHSGIGMYDPFTATWYLRNEAGPGPPDAGVFRFGAPGWVPVAGDWDGNGTVTVGVVDPATMTWYLRNSNSAGAPDVPPFRYGGSGWKPVVGDWDADGRTTVGAVDPGGLWYLRFSNTPGPPDLYPFPYGLGGWMPVAGNQGVPQLPLRGAGADPALLGRLSSAEYVPALLGGVSLGLTGVASQVVRLDGAAAGYGWFVDPTPLRDEEFAVAGPGSPLAALPGPAAGKMDLLTAVLHEMGHLAGRPDLDAPGHAGDLMTDLLSPGTRRTEALDAVFAGGM